MAETLNNGNPRADFHSQLLRLAIPYVDQYQAKMISEKGLINGLRQVLYPEYARILNLEMKIVAQADMELGIVSQTTDTSGSRKLDWFEQTGLSYSTGIPSSTIAVAVMHPEVGMSAVNKNLITIEDVIQLVATVAKSPTIQKSVETASRDLIGRMIASNESLEVSVRRATGVAMTDFARLTHSGIPTEGTRIALLGGDFLTTSQVSFLTNAAMQVVKTHPAMNDGKAMHSGRKIRFSGQLGESDSCGMLWGGPHHPLYSEPVFYSKSGLRG